jgi:hypothetical protein
MTLPEELKDKQGKLRRPSVLFLVCLLIAGLGWCIINFSDQYRVTLTYRVNCYDIPNGKTLVGMSDSMFTLTFNTRGLNYLSSKFSDANRVLPISLKKLVANKGRNRNSYTFTAKELNSYITENNLIDPDFIGVENINSWTVELE